MEIRHLLIGVLIGVIGSLIAFAITPSPELSRLEARIEELEEEAARYYTQVEMLEKELTSLRDLKEGLEAELQEKEAEVESLQSQLSELEQELAAWRERGNITLIAVSFSRTRTPAAFSNIGLIGLTRRST